MQRWCSKLRSIAAVAVRRQPFPEIQNHQQLLTSLHHLRRHHYTPNFLLNKPLIPSSIISPNFLTTLHSHRALSLPLSFTQVRNLTLKQRKRKLKSRQPPSPIVSKLKKIKMKSYSSFKGRFRTMKDGQIRRWKEGKRHNAHLKSKIAKRRGRLPALVPAAYAKVMKKLNFCG